VQALPGIDRGLFLAIALLAAVCISGTASAVTRVDGLTINVTYSANSIRANLSNGTALTSGAVLSPGLYSVIVYDDSVDPNPMFTMTGPGAVVSSDLNPNGMGIEVPVTLGPFVLAASSSYTISDSNLGGGSVITFTTAATGTSASPNSSPASPANPSSPGSGTTKTSKTLALIAMPSGKPAVTFAGKAVTRLAAGRYSVVVSDLSKKAGLVLGHGKLRPVTLSSAAAVGTSVRTVQLTAGKWFLETSTRGPKVYFTVG
jgi:hypothetical protein